MSDEPSPYVTGGPIAAAPSFVGRDALLRSLGEAISRNRCFVLIGGPKTGRTSVLDTLWHRAHTALRQPAVGRKEVVVVVDVAALAANSTPQALVPLVWEAVQKAVLDPFVQNHAAPPRPIKLTVGRHDNPWDVFDAAAKTLWEQLANTPGWCRYALLLDNAAWLGEPACYENLARLMASVSRIDAARPQAIGLCGDVQLRQAVGPHNKALRSARLHVLEPLRAVDAHALGRLGNLPIESIDAAYAAVGGHPFLLQRVLAALYEAPQDDPRAVCASMAKTCEAMFADILASLPVARRGAPEGLEQTVLTWLLEAGGEGDVAQAEAQLQAGPLRAACDVLVACGVVERSVRGGGGAWLRLTGELLRNWLREHVG